MIVNNGNGYEVFSLDGVVDRFAAVPLTRQVQLILDPEYRFVVMRFLEEGCELSRHQVSWESLQIGKENLLILANTFDGPHMIETFKHNPLRNRICFCAEIGGVTRTFVPDVPSPEGG